MHNFRWELQNLGSSMARESHRSSAGYGLFTFVNFAFNPSLGSSMVRVFHWSLQDYGLHTIVSFALHLLASVAQWLERLTGHQTVMGCKHIFRSRYEAQKLNGSMISLVIRKLQDVWVHVCNLRSWSEPYYLNVYSVSSVMRRLCPFVTFAVFLNW